MILKTEGGREDSVEITAMKFSQVEVKVIN